MILGMSVVDERLTVAYLCEQAIADLAEDVGEGLFERAAAYLVHFDDEEVRLIAASALAEAATNKARSITRSIEQASISKVTAEDSPPGVEPVSKAQRAAATEKYCQQRDAGMATIIRGAADQFATQLRVTWTKDLLNAPISSRDGQFRTTWGEATLEQHQERYEMFMSQAVANADGASRHREAINLLELTGAPCLRKALET